LVSADGFQIPVLRQAFNVASNVRRLHNHDIS